MINDHLALLSIRVPRMEKLRHYSGNEFSPALHAAVMTSLPRA